jgi:hypothetical protein
VLYLGQNFGCSFCWQDDFKLKSCQLQSFITFRDLQLLFWLFLHPKSFEKFCLQNLEISLLVFMKLYEKCRFYEQRYYHFVEWRNDRNKIENFFIWINLLLQNVLCRSCLPSVKSKTFGKDLLCRVQKKNTRQRASLPSVWHSANKLFAECFLVALGMPEKLHSAKSRFPVVQHVITKLTSN